MVFRKIFGNGGSDKREVNVEESSIGDGFITVELEGKRYNCNFSVSEDETYTLAFADGRNGGEVKGRVFLLEDRDLLFSDKVSRPNSGKVSNSGVCAVVDWIDWDSLGGRLLVYDKEGEILFEKDDFDSNLEYCALKNDLVACGVLNPDCKTYIFNYNTGEKIAEHENIDGNKFDAEFIEKDNDLFLELYDRHASEPEYAINMDGEKI